MMILYFLNKGTSVTFQGVYQQTGGTRAGHWQQLPELGRVLSADYKELLPQAPPVFRTRLEVRGIREDDQKLPVWDLWDAQRGVRIPVSGDALRSLSLHIQFRIAEPVGDRRIELYRIDFAGTPASHDPDKNERHSNATYNMQWTLEGVTPPQLPPQDRGGPYCHRSVNNPDSVVFQQHIFVDPRTGKVSHPQDDARVQNFVTMSCYLGAPATVARWGYEYDSATPSAHFYFDAAIQMKRASYCADEHAYTKAGTEIAISDSANVKNDVKADAGTIEASWTRDGATCLNQCQARHPELLLPGSNCKDNHFSCSGNQLRTCTPGDIAGKQKIYDALPDPR